MRGERESTGDETRHLKLDSPDWTLTYLLIFIHILTTPSTVPRWSTGSMAMYYTRQPFTQIIFRNSVSLSGFPSRKQILTHLYSSYWTLSSWNLVERRYLPVIERQRVNGPSTLTHYPIPCCLIKVVPGSRLTNYPQDQKIVDVLGRNHRLQRHSPIMNPVSAIGTYITRPLHLYSHHSRPMRASRI